MSIPRRNVAAFLAVLFLAAALRVHRLDWGLPDLFEEATPFFRAFDMIGGADGSPTADPEFFRYPSLVFYAHAAGQALLAAWLALREGAEAWRDLPATFLADRTPFLYVARFVSAIFGVVAVAGTWAAGFRLGGVAVALPAALVLATNAFHIERSQFIDVDGPLAAAVAWGLWACLRIVDRGTGRDHALAGALAGLAASAKYPGAFMLVPVVAASIVRARRSAKIGPLVAAFAAAGLAFAATSPYVVIRASAAARDLAAERQHMERGHFGDGVASARAYAAEAPRLFGWPVMIAAVAGAAVGLARRRRATIPLLAFVVALLTVLCVAKTNTPRYLLPLFPPIVLLAALPIGELRQVSWRVVATCALLLPAVLALPRAWAARAVTDPRSEARAWIESNVAPGSFLVMEAWGPDLLEPIDLWSLAPDVRDRFLERSPRPLYAILNLPSFQVMPELSEAASVRGSGRGRVRALQRHGRALPKGRGALRPASRVLRRAERSGGDRCGVRRRGAAAAHHGVAGAYPAAAVCGAPSDRTAAARGGLAETASGRSGVLSRRRLELRDVRGAG